MGLYVKMRIPLLRAEEVLRRKIILFSTLNAWLSYFFYPSIIEIWKDAPSEALKGKLVITRKVPKDIAPTALSMLIDRLVKASNIPPLNIIIRIEGSIKVNEAIIPAYMAMYNTKAWREVYGDIEFDIYASAKRNIGSLAELYLKYETVKRTLNETIKKLMGYKEPKIIRAVIGFTSDALIDFRERVGTSHREPPTVITDMMRTMRVDIMEKRAPDKIIKLFKHIRPYKERLISTRLWRLREFDEFFKNILKISGAVQEPMPLGLMVYATREETFKVMYDEMLRNFFEPLAEQLIDEDRLISIMRAVITKTKPLY